MKTDTQTLQLMVELDNPLSVIPGHSIKEADQPHTPVAIVHSTHGTKGPRLGHERAKYIVRAVNSHETALAALKAAQSAMNQIPNKRLSGEHKDSYAVAALVDRAITAMEGGK